MKYFIKLLLSILFYLIFFISFSISEVVDEIKGLRQDIQNQPIMINVDGKVVSEITKVQSRKLSTRLAGYFGG